MQLFSRNKALAALSLSALAVLGACGDDVTVPPAINPAVVLTISPSNANMNVGESLNFAVQITGGSATTPPTLASCTSSNTAVATVAISGSACRVTAVAAGNATITAAASTGNQAASVVSVSAPAPAITSLGVSPAAAQLAVGQSVTIIPTVQPAGRTATYAYTTSSAAIATVAATGVVTAVAPGVATITVTATAAAQGGLAAATIAQAVTITVSDRTPGLTQLSVQPATVALALNGTQQLTPAVQGPRASAVTYTYGSSAPSVATVSATGVITAVAAGQAVVTVTASATESGAFAATALTALVPVTVSPAAQVVINSLTKGGSTIDISNVYDQIEVNLQVAPNGQTVTEANVWVCDPSETVAACQARTNGVPAARQSFSSAGAQLSSMQLYINTSEFGTPDFTTGVDANTIYKNGLRTIVATLTTNPNSTATQASNSISQVNFNNPDGWTVRWTAPANRTNDPNNITWYGGPSTPDALTPNAQSGAGSFVVVPVIYTPNRTVVQAMLNLSSGCGSNITDRTRPFAATYGTTARDTLAVNFNCSGMATTTTGLAPFVSGGVDNNNNGYTGTTATPAVGRSIFDDFSNIANATTGGFRQSLAYRQNYLYLPHDYVAPTINYFDVRGGSTGDATTQDSAWVNAAYFMAGTNVTTATSVNSSFRYSISDNEVGLTSANGAQFGAGAAQRNTLFSVCAQPNGIPTTQITTTAAAVNCTSPVATGGITATIGSMNVPEQATNFTNTAYFAQVAETDRLGNRATSIVYTTTGTGSVTKTPGRNTTATGPAVFGVDLTAPVLAVIPNTGTGSLTNFVRTDVDSIYSALGNTYGTTNNTNAIFAVRFTDARAGFFNCVPAAGGVASQGNCPATTLAQFAGAAGPTQVNGGTFNIQRRTAPVLPSLTNDAVNESIIRTANTSTTDANRNLNVINAPVYGGDASYREFVFNIHGFASRVASSVTLTGAAPGAAVAGYYTFSGTLVDRAGNTTAIPARSVAIDNAAPQITGITVPAILAGGTSVAFGPTGTDDLEAIAGDLSLRYPQLGYDFGGPGNAVVAGQPNTIRFRRVTNYSASSVLGLWHNPFAAVSDNKLATPIGAATLLGAAQLPVPIPFIQNIVNVSAANAPLSQANTFAAFGAADEARPNQVTAWLYDIRATMANNNIGTGISAALNATIFGGQIPTPAAAAQASNWGTTQGIQTWQIFNAASVSGFEYRAQTGTSVTNPPFTAVYIIRQVGATEWEYIGQASSLGQLDQGGNRFWRYGITTSAINQGAGATMAALSNADVIRAIGVDASGNGLSTLNALIGLAPALPGTVTVTNTAIATPYANAAAADPITLGVSANPNAANLVFGCSSNSAFLTAQMTGPTTCTLTPNGVAAGPINIQVTFTATGSLGGFNTNTVTSTVNVQRIP